MAEIVLIQGDARHITVKDRRAGAPYLTVGTCYRKAVGERHRGTEEKRSIARQPGVLGLAHARAARCRDEAPGAEASAEKNMRTEVPQEIADQVIFESDRTCCVCRERSRPVQVHHIDEDPSNHDPANLAVLCFDCHRDTQITGGFDRKLSSGQVRRYREDWLTRVENNREARDGPKHSLGEQPRGAAHAIGESEAHAMRNAMGTPGFWDYVRSLPEIHRQAYIQGHLLWDTGVTSKMREGSYGVIEVLKGILLELAKCYPPNHFGPDTKVYFDEYIKSRFSWAYKKLEPNGPGTGGTIVLVEAGAEVMKDLEEMIAGIVRTLSSGRGDFNYNVWLEEWKKA